MHVRAELLYPQQFLHLDLGPVAHAFPSGLPLGKGTQTIRVPEVEERHDLVTTFRRLPSQVEIGLVTIRLEAIRQFRVRIVERRDLFPNKVVPVVFAIVVVVSRIDLLETQDHFPH